MKEKIIEILKSHQIDIENINTGYYERAVIEDEFYEIADKIVSLYSK